METLAYLSKVNACWLLFYGCYWLLFRKHTFFALNRIYLLLTLMIGFVIPAIELRETVEGVSENVSSAIVTGEAISARPSAGSGGPWELLVLGIYFMGVALMLMKLVSELVQIRRIVRNGMPIRMNGYRLVISQRCAGAGSFSFLKWIVISTEDYESHVEPILRHELIHVRQWHTLDVLLIEVLKVCFWFNPALWFYKDALRQVHEFLADNAAKDRDSYAAFLIAYARKGLATSVSNQFFHQSLLKQRIYMIYKEPTPRWIAWKYLSIFPLLGATVMLMAAKRYEYVQPRSGKITGVAVQHIDKQYGIGGALVGESLKTVTPEMQQDRKSAKKQKNNTAALSAPALVNLSRNGMSDKDSLAKLDALISKLRSTIAEDDLAGADSLKKEIYPKIWQESARLKKEQTELKLRSQGFAESRASEATNALDRLRSDVMQSSREAFELRFETFDKTRKHFEEVAATLRKRLSEVTAESDKVMQERIVNDLIAEGVVTSRENLTYRLHNMFLIVNGVEQSAALHQKLKARYLKFGWMEWVYNWDGITGHRFTGVRFNG